MEDGFVSSMVRAQVSLDTGGLQLHRTGYLADPDLKLSFSPAELATLQARLKKIPEIQAFSPRLLAEGLIQSAYGSTGVEIRGFDPELESRTTTLSESLVAGRFLSRPGQIIMGRPLAQRLNLRLGERAVLQVQGLTRPHSLGLRLVGLLSTGLSPLDRSTVFVHLQDARTLTEVPGASELALAVQHPARVQRRLQALLGPGIKVSTFMDLNPLLSAVFEASRFEGWPIMFLLALLASFGVANTITATVLERTRELGIMMALGLRPGQLKRLIGLEALLTSGLGFLLGALLGYGLNAYLARVGFDLSAYSQAFPDLGMPHVLYSTVSVWHGIYAFSAVVLTALFAARLPARRAAGLEPTEAMRYV